MILSQSIGSYSQTIRVNRCGGNNEVEVRREGIELYDGVASHIVDEHNKLRFKDVDGKQHEYIK